MNSDLTVYNQEFATPLQNEQWYITLIDECKDIIIETEFTSRWSLVEGYHSLGKRILAESERFKKYDERIDYKSQVAVDLNKSKRTIYYAVQFAREYPDLNLLNEGKNISWHHIVNKYLTTGEKKSTVTKGELMKQIEEIKKLLENQYSLYHQEDVNLTNSSPDAQRRYNHREVKAIINFIRFLQDQVNKITGGRYGII